MTRKKRSEQYNMDDEVIIGYNVKLKKDKTTKKQKKPKITNNTKQPKKVNNNKSNERNVKKTKKTTKTSVKKKKNNKAKKILFAIIKLMLIIAIIVGILFFLFVSPVFNITKIRVENASKISANTYIVLSEIHEGENIFKIRKEKAKEMIKHESYVEDVKIRREYPGTVVIDVTERTPKYMIEKSGMYIYIDKNGYILEISQTPLDTCLLTGILTDLDNVQLGSRLLEEDISKFSDLIKITDGLKNNNIEAKLYSIDISDSNNYALEFKEENKKVILGDVSNLSTKMLWIKELMELNKDESGTIHLDTNNIYFSPEQKTEK